MPRPSRGARIPRAPKKPGVVGVVVPTQHSSQTRGELSRSATVTRKTSETDVRVELTLDGTGSADIRTGIGFLDHMLTALARHGRMDLVLTCKGDLHIDDHHTAEDCALVLGTAIDRALGDRVGIARFGSAYAPLDEAVSRTVLDLSGRPFARVDLGLVRDRVGDLSAEMLTHVFSSIAIASRSTLHVEVLRGENDHHRAESAMKSFALALRQAVARDGSTRVPSTKETL